MLIRTCLTYLGEKYENIESFIKQLYKICVKVIYRMKTMGKKHGIDILKKIAINKTPIVRYRYRMSYP